MYLLTKKKKKKRNHFKLHLTIIKNNLGKKIIIFLCTIQTAFRLIDSINKHVKKKYRKWIRICI